MPDHRPARGSIKQQVIWGTVAVKICNRYDLPATRRRWTRCGADDNIVVEIPNRRLTRAWVVKKKIGPSIAVEIRRRQYWRDANVIDVLFAIECSCVCDVRASVVRNNCDVITDLVLIRITDKWVKRIAPRDLGRPAAPAINAVGIEELRIGVVCGVSCIEPDDIDSPVRCDRERAEPVPFRVVNRVVIDPT